MPEINGKCPSQFPNMTFLNRFCPTDSPMHKEHFAIFLCQWLKQLLNFKIIEAEFYAN